MAVDLPPKPDPATGNPRPPVAPLVLNTPQQPTKTLHGVGEPPQGRGTVLEAHGEDPRAVLFAAAILVTVFVAFVAWTSEGPTASWLGDPIFWIITASIALITIARDWNTRIVAGAEWLRVNRRWVDTYQLTDITMRGVLFGWMLRLRDSEGRRVRTYITNIEANRKLWALVYNGMAHSVHDGARINNVAAGMLRLRPGFEALRSEARRPKIPDRVVWTFLLVIVVIFGAIYLFRPALLGPALMVFAAIVLVAMTAISVLIYLARKHENALDSRNPEPQSDE